MPVIARKYSSIGPDITNPRSNVPSNHPKPSPRRGWTTADQIERRTRVRDKGIEQLEHLAESPPETAHRESRRRSRGKVLRRVFQFLNAILPLSILTDVFVYPSWSSKNTIFNQDELENAREHLRHVGGQPIRIPVKSYALGIPVPKRSVNLDGMFLPAQKGTQKTVIFCNPNAACYELTGEVVNFYRNQLKCNVLLFNYRGAGESQGRPTAARTLKDMEAVFKFATKTLDIAPKNLLVHGRSLGGAHAAKIGSEHPEVTVICDRTFASLEKAANGMVGGGVIGAITGKAAYAFASNDLSTHTLYQRAKGNKLCVSCHHDEMFKNYEGPGGDVIHLNSKQAETHNKWSTTFKSKAFTAWVRKNFLNA